MSIPSGLLRVTRSYGRSSTYSIRPLLSGWPRARGENLIVRRLRKGVMLDIDMLVSLFWRLLGLHSSFETPHVPERAWGSMSRLLAPVKNPLLGIRKL